MPEKEEAEAVVQPHHQAHDAVAVVDLQGWQAGASRGCHAAMAHHRQARASCHASLARALSHP